MNYAEIKTLDVANGPGIRLSLFVSGCNHKCVGCFNELAWDFNYGKPFDESTIDYIIETINSGPYQGMTLLGGEPLEPVNQKGLLPLVRRFKKECPDKDLWCFSGFTYEYIMENMCGKLEETEELLSYIDVLVDGPFVQEKRNLMLKFRGSENQRLIDLKKTLKENKVILWDK